MNTKYSFNRISLNQENWESAFENWDRNHNYKLSKGLRSGDIIRIEDWMYVTKEQLQQDEAELNSYLDMLYINHIRTQKGTDDEIIAYCFAKVDKITQMLERYFAEAPLKYTFITPFRLICRSIVELPIHILKSIDVYPDSLSPEQRVYYRHKYIRDKAQIAKSKYNYLKFDMESFFNEQLATRQNKLLIFNIFLFTDQFINELKYYKPIGLNNFFDNSLFRVFFYSIVNFKNKYKEVHNDFSFDNINELIHFYNNSEAKIEKSELSDKLSPIRRNNEIIFDTLNKEFQLEKFLQEKGISTKEIKKLIIERTGRDFLPFSIALLAEVGFLKFLFDEHFNTKNVGFKRLSKIFDVNERRIKGNINILTEASTENPIQYTSYQHIDKVKYLLANL